MPIQAFKENINETAIAENSFANNIFKQIRDTLCNKLGYSSIDLSKDNTFFATYPNHFLTQLFDKGDSPKINFQEIDLKDLMLDKGAMITPLRISTPKTDLRSTSGKDYKQTTYFQQLKSHIKAQEALSKSEKKQILELLNTLQVASQELFSQTMSNFHLNKVKECFQDSEKDWATLSEDWQQFNDLINQHQLDQGNFSKKEVLAQRQSLDKTAKSLIATLKSMDNPEARNAISHLYQSLCFTKQTNDLHFQYADKPSYCFSNAVDQIEKWGGRVALAASIVGILSVATALTLPALGIAVPAFVATAAAISTTLTLAVGFPLAFKKIGQSIYNGIKYNAAPTKGELVNATLTGTSMLAAGTTGLVGTSALQGVGIATAAGAFKATNNISKSFLGVAGAASSHRFNQFKEKFQQTKERIQQQSDVSDDVKDDESNAMPDCSM